MIGITRRADQLSTEVQDFDPYAGLGIDTARASGKIAPDQHGAARLVTLAIVGRDLRPPLIDTPRLPAHDHGGRP